MPYMQMGGKMWRIKSRLDMLQQRKEITKYTKTKKENQDSFVIATKSKKLYDYYICDYCEDEIRLDAKQEERSGGIVVFPHTLTKSKEVKLVLCNKCLVKAIKEFTEEENGN